jgi:hypothetical protein
MAAAGPRRAGPGSVRKPVRGRLVRCAGGVSYPTQAVPAAVIVFRPLGGVVGGAIGVPGAV